MRRFLTGFFVSLAMIIGILAITDPGRDQSTRMFDHAEGKLVHDYVIFSVYMQTSSDSLVEHGKYKLYKRYIGIGAGFFEISPLKVEQQP